MERKRGKSHSTHLLETAAQDPCTHALRHLHGSKQKLNQINMLSQREESHLHQEILKISISCLLFSR